MDALPEPKYLGKTDGIPQELDHAFILMPGGVPVDTDNSTLTLGSSATSGRTYQETFYIDIRLRAHRDDWVLKAVDLRDELIRSVNALNIPSITLQGVDEPDTAIGDLDFVEIRTNWLHTFFL
jgi:hypothetical protein